MRARFLLIILVAAVILGACESSGPPAQDFLPEMSQDEYDIVKADGLQTALESFEVWTLLSGDPLLVAKIELVDNLIQCTQETGSIAIKAYDLKESPLVAGVAVVVNINRLASWETAAACFGRIVNGIDELVGYELRPCASWWRYDHPDADYYMFLAGTSMYICQDMCNTMKGCPKPDMVEDIIG